MHHMVLLFSPPCPLNLQGIKRSRCTEGAETKSSTSVFTVLPLPSLLTQPCTLPVTESAALEEQVAAGDRANLTWLLEPEGTQFRRILKWLISANKSIKTNSHLFAITAWFCENKSNLLPNPVTKQKPGSNTPIFNHALTIGAACCVLLHTVFNMFTLSSQVRHELLTLYFCLSEIRVRTETHLYSFAGGCNEI